MGTVGSVASQTAEMAGTVRKRALTPETLSIPSAIQRANFWVAPERE